MSYADNPYQSPLGMFAAQAGADERSDFITKTYLHLAGAIGLFVVLEAVLLQMPGIESLVQMMIGSQYGWLVVLGLFMVVSYVAQNWAQSAVSPGTQYLGLGLYVVAEAVIFVPLLYIARKIDPGIILSAGLATLVLFAGLTAIVFVTRKDFSFLRTVLAVWRAGGVGLDRGRGPFSVRPGTDLYVRHDRPGLRLHSLPHLECLAPLPHRSARGGRPGIVRVGGAAVLVHSATLPLPARLIFALAVGAVS